MCISGIQNISIFCLCIIRHVYTLFMHVIILVLVCFITAPCAGLVGNGMTVFQYDDNVEGSVLTISCLEGYFLPEEDVEFVCTSNGSWSPDPLDYLCIPKQGT